MTISRRAYVASGALLVLIGAVLGVVFAITTHFADAHEDLLTETQAYEAALEYVTTDTGIMKSGPDNYSIQLVTRKQWGDALDIDYNPAAVDLEERLWVVAFTGTISLEGMPGSGAKGSGTAPAGFNDFDYYAVALEADTGLKVGSSARRPGSPRPYEATRTVPTGDYTETGALKQGISNINAAAPTTPVSSGSGTPLPTPYPMPTPTPGTPSASSPGTGIGASAGGFAPLGATAPTDTVDLTEVEEEAIKLLFDADGRMLNPHREMQDAVKDVDGGFGGYYFDPANPTTAYVYMKDVTKTAEAENAFRDVYPRNAKFTQVVVVPGAYTVDELTDWFYAAVPALDGAANVTVTSWSMNIMGNEFQLTVATAAQATAAWALLDDLGIPRGAVDLTVGEPTTLADGDNVQSKWRPVAGGVKGEGPVECTIGFVTERAGEEGMVVASHCTNSTGRIGGVSGSQQYQPDDGETPEVGTEDIDPGLEHIDHWACPNNATNCRYSDAAFVDARDVADIISRGKIAKPLVVGTKTVNPAYDTFRVTSDAGGFAVGDTINYVGMKRGWRQGTVTDTCSGISYTNPSARIVCTGKVSVTGSSIPQGGDSGAPVFLHIGNETEVLGTITGRVPGEDYFHFSKIVFRGAAMATLHIHREGPPCWLVNDLACTVAGTGWQPG